MKFSTVAASAVLFGTMVMAAPAAEVVYETEVVTVTSCAPEVTDCPYRTTPVDVYPEATSTTCTEEAEVSTTPVEVYPQETSTTCTEEVPETTEAPVYTSPPVDIDVETSTTCTEEVPETTEVPVVVYTSTPVDTYVETTPCPESTSIVVPVTYPNSTAPVCPGGYGCPVESTYPVPTGTGVPYPPPPAGNTTTPQVVYPTPSAPTENSGASKLVGSFAAVLGVAAVALFA